MPSTTPITIAPAVSSIVSSTPLSTRGLKRYSKKTFQCSEGAVTMVPITCAAMASTTTAPTHRHTWRTGTALSAAGGTRPSAGVGASTAVSDAVVTRRASPTHAPPRADRQYEGTQDEPDGLLLLSDTACAVIAPSVTPHCCRMLWYAPLVIRYFTASVIACSSGLPLTTAMPYGVTLHGDPASCSWPPDCFTWYAATGESAHPMSARPEMSAWFASVCF